MTALIVLATLSGVPSARLIAIQQPTPSQSTVREPFAPINNSNDVAWLRQLALSKERASELAESLVGRFRARDVREVAYMRLNAIGTRESVAAVLAVEAALANISLTPATVNVDFWPMAPGHYSELPIQPLVESISPDGTTYRVVYRPLLGERSLFVTSSRTPADRNSWARPLLVDGDLPNWLIDHNATNWPRSGTLAWRDSQTATLRITGAHPPTHEMNVSLARLRQDSDGDGWTDVEEKHLGLDPRRADSDGDGLPDSRDVCPLLPRPIQNDAVASAIRRLFLLRFGFSESRDVIFVEPSVYPVHLIGYGGPVLFRGDIPRAATTVRWEVVSRTVDQVVIDISDGIGRQPMAGGRYMLKRVEGEWMIAAPISSWLQ